MTDLPENVDLQWIGREILALRQDMADVKSDLRAIRDDLSLLVEALEEGPRP